MGTAKMTAPTDILNHDPEGNADHVIALFVLSHQYMHQV